MKLLRVAAVSSVAGKRSARNQMEQMQVSQAQQQAAQAQQQALQAQQAAQSQQLAQTQPKKDPMQELQKWGSLKDQGLITEEEFAKKKAQILAES